MRLRHTGYPHPEFDGGGGVGYDVVVNKTVLNGCYTQFTYLKIFFKLISPVFR